MVEACEALEVTRYQLKQLLDAAQSAGHLVITNDTTKPMSNKEKVWIEFLNAWPPEKVSAMTLDEYTNLNREDSFCYWE